MDNYSTTYQPNWYYQQPGQTPVVYPQRNWQTPVYSQPIQYQQQYQQVQQQQNVQPQSVNNGAMQWVQGESGAKAYMLPNGTTLPLWDSEAQTIYVKSVDQNGKPSLTILDYVERGSQTDSKQENAPAVEYATKEQIDAMNLKFTEINDKLSALSKYVTKDQFQSITGQLNDLSGQIEDIENRIMSFGKPQQNQNNRKGNN